jgi:hypothetical protein
MNMRKSDVRLAILAKQLAKPVFSKLAPNDPALPPHVLAFNVMKGTHSSTGMRVPVPKSESAARAEPPDNLNQYFGGGWTRHEPGDFVPEFAGSKVEFLVDTDPKLKSSKSLMLWNSPTQIVAIINSKACWNHTQGFVHVHGYRYVK